MHAYWNLPWPNFSSLQTQASKASQALYVYLHYKCLTDDPTNSYA